MKFDLGGFKKIHEDQKSATLMHPTGHKFVIDKQKLRPHLLKQLDSLEHFDEGGEVYPAQEATDPNLQEMSADYVPNEEVQQSNNVMPALSDDKDLVGREPSGGMTIESDKAVAPNQVAKGDESGMEPQNPQLPQAPVLSSKPNNNLMNTLPNVEQYMNQLGGAYQGLGQAAIKSGEAQAQGIQEQAAQQQANSEQMASLHQTVQDMQNHFLGEADSVIHDMNNGHINPNQYMENRSVGSKIMTGIGLLLGGMGGGILGTENPALKFLNSQIDRNILAQQKNYENKNTVFNAYLNKFGSFEKATDMTKGILQLKMASDIAAAGANSNSELVKQQSQALAQKYKIDAINQMMPLAFRQAAINFINKNPNIDPSVANRVLGQSGIIPEKDKEEIDKEIVKGREVEGLRQGMKQSYDKINGLYGRGIVSPAMRAAEVNLLAGRAVKLGEGRFNFDEAAQQMDAMLPRRFEGPDTTNQKALNIDKFSDSMRNESVGPGYGISIPKGKTSMIHQNRNVGPNYPKHRGK